MRQTADCEPETVAERPVQNAQADGFVGSRNVSPIVFLAPGRSSEHGPWPRPRSDNAIRSRLAECREALCEPAVLSGVRANAMHLERGAVV